MKSTYLLLFLSACTLHAAEPVTEIAFGSCYRQSQEAPIFKTIADLNPDVFVAMGDNIYGDTEDMDVLEATYQKARNHPEYLRIRENSAFIGTWDDHDFGQNDAGKEYPMKAEAQQVFLDFFDVPADSPRRKQEGVHSYSDFGPSGKMTRIILLDTRYFRDAHGSDGDMLGDTQWKWLEQTLEDSPAQINILVSSIQVLMETKNGEKWFKFPSERKRLLRLLSQPEIPPVLLLSGDTHFGEIQLDEKSCGYPLYDITSSSLNSANKGAELPSLLRIGEQVREDNFGLLSIDWSTAPPTIRASLRDTKGVTKQAIEIQLKR